jgi:hypothetical protein
MRLMGTDEFAGNLRMYLMLPANTMRYYPFFFSNGLPVGVLPRLTLIAGAVLFPFTLRRPGLRRDPVWAVGGLFLLGAAVLNLAVLCLALFPGVDRYVVDFAPAGLLLGCAVLFAALDAAAAWPAPGRVACRVALLSVALWTLGNGACFGLANRVPTAFRAGLEAASDTLVYRIERLVGSVQGPLELKVVFPQDPGARRDPIVTTGNLAGTGDIVYALYPDSAHVQFGYFHMGAGGPLGVPIAADLETPHTIRVDLGSLYPPRRHPMFDTWSDAQVARLRRRLKVTLDGQTALEASVDVYPSEPGGVRVGENSIAPDVSAGRFGGRILEQRRLGLAAPAPGDAYPGGPVRLTLRWSQILDANEPLVSTGRNGAGDLLNVQVLDGGRVRFQHDSWDSPDVITEPISTDMDAEHVVEIEMGSLYPEGMPGVSAAERCRFALWVDGQPVIDMDRPFHPSTADEVEFGFNAIGGGSSTSMFTGTILGRACVPGRVGSDRADRAVPQRRARRQRAAPHRGDGGVGAHHLRALRGPGPCALRRRPRRKGRRGQPARSAGLCEAAQGVPGDRRPVSAREQRGVGVARFVVRREAPRHPRGPARRHGRPPGRSAGFHGPRQAGRHRPQRRQHAHLPARLQRPNRGRAEA